MNKQASKDVLYGGLVELVNNPKFYYHSSIGSSYCHWTEDGAKVVAAYMTLMADTIYRAEQEALDKRAKDMVLSNLKGNAV